MSYQRVISTMGCPERTLGEVAALAQDYKLDGVELRSLGGQMDLPAYFVQTYGTPDRMWFEAKRMGVNIVALNTSMRLCGATEADRTAFLLFVPWAEALGVKWLRVFDGGEPGSATAFNEAVATLAWWRGRKRAHGWKVDVMVETHDSLFTAEAIRRFVAAAGNPAIRWDSHHTWKRGGEDPVVTWAGIKAHVVSIDVKDSVSRPDERHPYTCVLPGEGEFPMKRLREVLAKEYRGVVCLEWEKMWHSYMAPLEDALRVAEERGWW